MPEIPNRNTCHDDDTVTSRRQMPTLQMQAVVMAASRGRRMTDLCAEDRPRCLMPVGPFPVIFYALRLLERHGFAEAICIVLESHRPEVQSALDKLPLKLQPQLVTIPTDSGYGTADSLRHIKDRLHSDVLLMAGDIVTNASLDALLSDFHQRPCASVSVLLLDNPHLLKGAPVAPDPLRKDVHGRADRDVAGIDSETHRLHFLTSSRDYDEIIMISGHMMRVNREFRVYTQFLDTHIYAIRRWVIDELVPERGETTIKDELVAYVIDAQLQLTGLKGDLEKPIRLRPGDTGEDLDFAHDPVMDARIAASAIDNNTQPGGKYSNRRIRCYATTDFKSFGVRLHTPSDYWFANKKIFSIWQSLFIRPEGGNGKGPLCPELVSESATIESTQVTESAIGEDCFVAPEAELKGSVLGKNCSVKSKARIVNSYLMNGVIIEEGVILENCVIADCVVIKKGCVLKDCMVGPSYTCQERLEANSVYLSTMGQLYEVY